MNKKPNQRPYLTCAQKILMIVRIYIGKLPRSKDIKDREEKVERAPSRMAARNNRRK